MLGLTFSFKLDLGPYIVSKKTGALIRLWSVFFLRLLFISMNRLYTHVWNTVVTSGLVPKLLLGIARQAAKANMQVCWSFTSCFSWTLGLSLRSGQLTCFLYRYYFGRCSSELAQLVPLPFSRGRSTRYSDRLHDSSVSIPRCYKDVYVSSFFSGAARLWNSLPIECFPLTYELNAFKSIGNRNVLTVGSF